jgi:hypothetical protein
MPIQTGGQVLTSPLRRRGTILAIATVAALMGFGATRGQTTPVNAAGRAAASPAAHRGILQPPRSVNLRAEAHASPSPGEHRPPVRPFLTRRSQDSSRLGSVPAATMGLPSAGDVSGPGPRSSMSLATTPSQRLLTTFPGASLSTDVAAFGQDQNVAPPDTQLAVGPSDIVEAVNATLSVWSKTGTALLSADLNSFFGVPGGYSFFDPRVVFDPATSRWLMSGVAAESTTSYVYLAVSQTSDPLGTWNLNTVVHYAGIVTDQPKLGFDSDVVVLSWGDFSGTSLAFSGEETWVLQKSELLTGSAVAVTSFGPDLTRFGVVPAENLTPTSIEYLTYNNGCGANTTGACNTGTSALGVVAITGTPAASDVTWTETDPAMAATTIPPDASQPGSSALVATNDDRFLTTTSDGATLYISGNVGCVPSGDTVLRPCAGLIKVSISGSASVTADRALGYPGSALYYPAVVPDANGDVFMAATFSSASVYPEAISLSLAAGGSSFSGMRFFAGSGANTDYYWGDYSGAAVDPSNPLDFWVAAEYAPTSGLNWGTAIGEVTARPNLSLAAPSSTTMNTPVTVTVTAGDGWGHTNTSYAGTIHFTSTDGAASLPADYSFIGADNGVHAFSITLNTSGSQTVTATDTGTPSIFGSATIAVYVPPAAPNHGNLVSMVFGPNHEDVITLGNDGNVWYMFWSGTAWWPSWTSIGAPPIGLAATSSISAVSMQSGIEDIYAIGKDGHLYYRYWNGSSWSPSWTDLTAPAAGLNASSELATVTMATGTQDVYATDVHGNVWYRYWSGTAWSAWTGLAAPGVGVKSGSNLTAVSMSHGTQDIYAVGADGNVWYRYWTGTVWSAWTNSGKPSVGIGASGVISASTMTPGTEDVYVIGTDGQVWYQYWGGTRWSAWVSGVGAPPAGLSPSNSALSVVSVVPGQENVAAVGNDNSVWLTYWTGSAWASWSNVIGAPPGGIA